MTAGTVPRFHVGTSGWYYRHWAGPFYPADLPSHRWFRFYAERFATVELNAPFYRFPTQSAVTRWRRQAPEGFVYAVKAPRLITHLKRFHDTERPVADLYAVLTENLGDKRGPVLFQLPPSLHHDAGLLETILGQLDPAFVNALEFRHASWWRADVRRRVAKAGAVFVSVSEPGLPDDLVVSKGRVYLRMHGVPMYRQDYSAEALAAWAGRLKAAKAKEAWVYFNNDADGHAPHNAATLRELLAA
jgi:uncharacterized protein YecE (DUF72 family)